MTITDFLKLLFGEFVHFFNKDLLSILIFFILFHFLIALKQSLWQLY